jgi:hypothetical protein
MVDFNPTVRQYAFKLHAYRRLPQVVISNMELDQLEFLTEILKPFEPREYLPWFEDNDFKEWFFVGDSTEAMFLRAQRKSMEVISRVLDDTELPDLEKIPAIKLVMSLAANTNKRKEPAKELRAIPTRVMKELSKKTEDDLRLEIEALKGESS